MADEILRRLDAHMERGNELMAEVRQEIRLNREFYAKQAAETRKLMERHEINFKHGLEVIEDNLAEMRNTRVAVRDVQRETRTNTRWIEAQTKAMLALIDEIRGD